MPDRLTLPAGFGRFVAFLILVAVVAGAFALIEPRFLSSQNLSAVTRHMATNGLAALGLTLVVIVRKFDLSFAGTACFAAMTIGFLIANGYDLWVCILVGLAAGAAIGAINGIAISVFGLPDIVTTIATGSIAGGLAFLYSKGRTIFQNFMQSGIIDLNDARILGYSVSFFFLIAIYAVAWFLMHRTRYGASFQATGENPVSAYFSGVPTKLYTFLAFVICGMTSVLAVVLILAESGTADTNEGANLLMPAYAGVFLGAALLGGTSVLATLAGTFLITMLLDGFSLIGVPYYYSDGVVSAILLAGVVLFDQRVRMLFHDLSTFLLPASEPREKRP
ncbi:ribose transport system permease protein/rhamnose transport system permease protein [Rhizobium sp. RU20A]|uniref:ABC transporter permease n=1 Tax=Rhizobium sp. RU20A TaxID=1907412 RepID=UPI00095526B6|nr:ABC transporter permease [Rhizobium sp. RU20A]SIQ96016.1 ribose transport system permease protein/rhamnose transport system permease protein [Rhizobium sp. RU20A]